MNKLYAYTDWVDWEMHGESLTAEKEDELAKWLEHMARRMSIFSRAEFPTDFGTAILTKFDGEFDEETCVKSDFFLFELKKPEVPRVTGMIMLYCE